MTDRGKLRVGSLAFPVVVVVVALLACKKKDEPPPPLAPEDAAAAVTAAPEAAVADTTDAAAAPAATDDTKPTTVVPVVRTDAGIKDSGVKDAAVADAAVKDAATSSTADYNAIQACCNALNAEAKKTGANQNKYKSAAAVCGGIAQKVKTGQADAASARTLIKAQLAGVPVPGSC